MKKFILSILLIGSFLLTKAQNSVDTLASGSVSSAANMSINISAFSSFRMIEIYYYDIVPVTSGSILNMLVSADGTTYDNGSGNYSWFWGNNAGFSENSASDVLARISGGGGLPNGTGQTTDGSMTIFGPGLTVGNPKIRGDMVVPGSPVADVDFAATRLTLQTTKGIRFQMSSGNISGKYLIVGYK